MPTLFALPNELLISSICSRYPCRDQQIRSLATLLSIRAASSRNIVIHGLEATGKKAVTKAVLDALSSSTNTASEDESSEELRYALVRSAECIGGRHLLEQTVGAVAKVLQWNGNVGRCESLSQLVVELGRVLANWTGNAEDARRWRLVLVFEGIDKQRDAPPTLLPALARLGEIIPNITTVFIVTAPRPNFLHSPGAAQIHFPTYSKNELLQILPSIDPRPPLPGGAKETKEVWNRFCPAVWDSLSKHYGRDIASFRSLCLRLWPKFVAPILDGSHTATPFSRLLVANRSLFQNDSVLVPGIVPVVSGKPQIAVAPSQANNQGIGAQLPYYSRLLLVAAYLASFNPPRTDQLFFMKSAAAKRKKKGGGTALAKGRPGVTKHRKISRKLLGPQAFILERLLAIFHAIKEDADERAKFGTGREVTAGAADIQMAIATLASLRLLIKVGAASTADTLDGGSRYRVAVSWEVVRTVARSVGVEAEDYLAE